MRLKVLASGSRGNAALLWTGETVTLVDAGVPIRRLTEVLSEAGVGHRRIDHVLVSHGHLDHARSAGIIAKRHDAALHCAAKIRPHRSVSRAPKLVDLPIGGSTVLAGRSAPDDLRVSTVRIPHDCDPTVALRMDHGGRALGVLSDMGEPREDAGKLLAGVHVLAIEANHDRQMLANGPYPHSLKERIRGGHGHLSNEQMEMMLARIASQELHTVILVHLSAHNNTPELARAAAQRALVAARRTDVRVLVAAQEAPLPTIDV